MNSFFAEAAEFNTLEAMFKKHRFSRKGDGPGDDGFILRTGGKKWAVSSDVSVENVHYKLDWVSPDIALEKAVLTNLSDINAMGGTGRLLFFNLGAKAGWRRPVYKKIGRILEKMEKAHGFRVCGGDLVRKSGSSFFSITVFGEVKGRPLLRSNCRPGHSVYVTGGLGAAAAGLRVLSGKSEGYRAAANQREPANRKLAGELVSRYHLPSVPLELGPVLSGNQGPVAAIDISDGLSSELGHLSRQSGVKILVDLHKLPAHPGLDKLFTGRAARNYVLHGGDHYGLLFTGNFTRSRLQEMKKAAEIYEIGTVLKGRGVFLRDDKGKNKRLNPKGWSH